MAGDSEALEPSAAIVSTWSSGQRALRISRIVGARERFRAVAVAAQVGDDHGELGGEAGRELAPAVQRQERRPTAGPSPDLCRRSRPDAGQSRGRNQSCLPSFRCPERPQGRRRHDVLFYAPHAGDVFGGDAECRPLLPRLVVGEPEMNDPVRALSAPTVNHLFYSCHVTLYAI
jgi:hypothetical protein